MKSKKELFKIMLTESYFHRFEGLCGLAFFLNGRNYLSNDELYEVLDYIGAHRPLNIRTLSGSTYYWNPSRTAPRRRWLRRHIRRNS